MLPAKASIAIAEHELLGARAWAERHGVVLEWLLDVLELRATLPQPETATRFYLRARLGDYRELPPMWTFCAENWTRDSEAALYPKPQATPHGSSIFLAHKGRGVICVPFNRLAYAEHTGPHGDWGGPAQWISAGGSHVRAATLGDMLAVVHRDLRVTRGTMAGG